MHIPSRPAFAILGSVLSLRQTVPNYELYTGCTEVCFDSSIATSGCVYTNEVAYIACLCSDGATQERFAQCIYTDCGSQALNDAAAIHMHNCQVNGSPAVLSEQQFIADGEAAGTGATSASASTLATATAVVFASSSIQGSTSPTTTAASPNTQPTATQANLSTPTSTPGGSHASDSGSGNNSLSTAALIGTIIASLTGAVGSCIGVWFGWKTYKNNKAKKEEEHSLVGNRAASVIELEKVKWRSETVPQD